jgi:hypothetical protein
VAEEFRNLWRGVLLPASDVDLEREMRAAGITMLEVTTTTKKKNKKIGMWRGGGEREKVFLFFHFSFLDTRDSIFTSRKKKDLNLRNYVRRRRIRVPRRGRRRTRRKSARRS